MKIPIENLYYLLCYAWNCLNEKEQVSVATDVSDTPLDLLARVLVSASKVLLKRGIDHSYREVSDEVPGIKGKLLLNQTLKSNLLLRQKTICSYDQFSSDTLPNRIWVTTLRNLLQTKGVNKQLKEEIIFVLKMLPPVSPLRITSHHFLQIRLNRNNRFYRFVLNICRLIHESLLPAETESKYLFLDFTRDEKKMALVFEAFVRNFYQLEQHRYSVSREQLNWHFTSQSPEHYQYLPKMVTDITLENEQEKIIIDTKYYSKTLNLHYDAEKIYSNNLYQLFSYLMNPKDQSEKAKRATGILLYPTIEKEYDLEYQYYDHPIRIQTLNLNTHWTEIVKRMKQIIRI